MTRGLHYGLLALATVLLAGATSLFVTRSTAIAPGEPEVDFHEWMHERLEITPAQDLVLQPFEESFESERTRLRDAIARSGRKLAEAVRAGEAGSQEIKTSLDELNSARAELQQITLDHFFRMKEHLDPDQAEKLLQWTHDSIVPEQ